MVKFQDRGIKKIVIIGIILISIISSVVILIGVNNIYYGGNNEWEPWPNIPGLGVGSVVFNRSPVNEEDYTYFFPLGHLGAPEHPIPTDHTYFVRNSTQTDNFSVYVPADGYIINIHKSVSSYVEYSILIMHTNTFMSWIGSIKYLNSSLIKEYEKSEEVNSLRIRVKTGDILGETDVNVDWGVYDKQVTLDFINPDILGSYTVHAVCPAEYCNQTLKNILYSRVYRVTPPLSGKIDYDMPGRLVGVWFLKGLTDTMNDPDATEKELSFVYDMYNGSKISIAFGGILNIPAINYFVINNTPDPETITVESGKIVYYLQGTSEFGNQDINATMVVQMIDNRTIKVEGFNGIVSSPSFTTDAKIYYR